MHLQSISNFRALAIIMIVAGHSYSFGFMGDDSLSNFIKGIVSGNTTLFVFISGYMFHHVFYKEFNYNKFIVNKFKNVGVPYLLLSSICLIYVYSISAGYYTPVSELDDMSDYYPAGIFGKIFSPQDSVFLTSLKYIFVGAPITAYWYIPFALLLFICAPIHNRYIKWSLPSQLSILLVFTLISLLTYRPEYRNPIINLLYFTPIYLIGMLCSLYREQVLSFLSDKLKYILLSYLFIVSFEVYIGFSGLSGKKFFALEAIDLIFIDKLLLIAIFWITLEKYQFNNSIINTISKTSFSIFFIHGWVIFVLTKLSNKFLNENYLIYLEGNNSVFIYSVSVVLNISFSVLLAVSVKKIFNGSKKTRYLFGY